jgi:predicted O-linked N-acetylglucosamine transferase (SPINDLY family)
MIVNFGDCEIDVERRELKRANAPVHVEPQVFDLIDYLVRNRDRVVSKDDLIASIWGDYAEAMRLARAAIRQRGDFVGGHRVLTAAAGMAGEAETAAAALQELRRAQPNVSLEWIAHEMPIATESERAHYLEGFRRAGLN